MIELTFAELPKDINAEILFDELDNRQDIGVNYTRADENGEGRHLMISCPEGDEAWVRQIVSDHKPKETEAETLEKKNKEARKKELESLYPELANIKSMKDKLDNME